MAINVPPHQEKRGFWSKFLQGLTGVLTGGATIVAGAMTGGAALPLGVIGGLSQATGGVLGASGKGGGATIANAIGQGAGIANMAAGKKGKPVALPQSTPTPTPAPQRTPVQILSQNNPAIQLQQIQDAKSGLDQLPVNDRLQMEPYLLQSEDELKRRVANRYKL